MIKGRALHFANALNRRLNESPLGRSKRFRGLKRRSRSLLFRILARDNLVLTRVGTTRLYVYADTGDFEAYHSKPYEPFTAELFTRSIRPGAHVVDIGAQFGYFTVLAALKTGEAGRVHSFEPVPTNLTVLRRNVELNRCEGVVDIVPKAVGEHSTTVPILISEGSHSHGIHPHPDIKTRQVLDVECVTLDDQLRDGKVDVMKMDIEGHEPHALKGMRKVLGRSRSLVLFLELAPVLLRSGGTRPEAFIKQIRDMGFTVQAVDEDARRLLPIAASMLQKVDPSWHCNLYCARA